MKHAPAAGAFVGSAAGAYKIAGQLQQPNPCCTPPGDFFQFSKITLPGT